MTFIPSVLTNSDPNNTINTPSFPFTGVWTEVTGYNMLILTISSDADGQINIEFSDNGSGVSTYFTDTYYGNTTYSKNFQLLKKYYRIVYQNGPNPTLSFSLSSRLSTILNTNSLSYDENKFKNKNNFALDAFGKLRVTNPTTLLDVKFCPTGSHEIVSNYEIVCAATGPNNIPGGATGVYQNGYCLITAIGNNQKYISQSRKYCTYQPGKSQLFLGSGIINAFNDIDTGGNNTTDTSSKIGYFDDKNGFFFEYIGGSNTDLNKMRICIRNNSNDTSTLQNSWNVDKMDGYGPSGCNLDFTKCQLFVIDFEWLAVGKIRFGFYINGIINYCHEILNINILTAPYMLTANLPIRYELSSSSLTAKASLMQICSTVISEGGYNPIGRTFSASTGITTRTLSSTGEYPILAIKAINTYDHQNIIPSDLDIYNTANNSYFIYRVRLYLSPSSDPFTASWNNVDINSVVQYAVAPTSLSVTNSIIIFQGYSSGRTSSNNINLGSFFNNIFQITSDINNNSDILLITAEKVSGTDPTILASISWQEIY